MSKPIILLVEDVRDLGIYWIVLNEPPPPGQRSENA